MTQLGFFDGDDDEEELSDPGVDEIGAFHGPASGAPETERASAIDEYPRTGTKRLEVLHALAAAGDPDNGGRGLTDWEGSQTTGIWLYTYAPRRVELLNGGWVEDSGHRRPTPSRKSAAVWRLTRHGREQHARRWGALS